MRKKYLLPIIMMLLFFLTPKSTYAFNGSYSYDINTVQYSATGVEIEGWAVLNGADGHLMHNISPKYKLLIEAKDKNGKVIDSHVYSNTKVETLFWERCSIEVIYGQPTYVCSEKSMPSDYTKAYYDVGEDKKPYPSTTYTNERCAAMSYAGSESSKFLINTTFRFEIPRGMLDGLGKSPTVSKIFLTLKVITENTNVAKSKIFGCDITAGRIGEVDIPLSIQSEAIKDPSIFDSFHLKIRNTASKVEVITNNGYVQGNENAFLSDQSYRLVYENKKIVQDDNHTPNLYFKAGRTYTVIEGNVLTDMGVAQPYNYYQLKINAEYSDGRYYAVDGGNTEAYIPAFWVKPHTIDNKPSYLELDNICTTKPECAVGVIDGNKTPICPYSGADSCCSLCDSPDYENTDFCTNPKKCGGESCDLCEPTSPYYNEYKNTDLCTNPKNPKKCVDDPPDDPECPYDDPQRCYCYYYGNKDSETCKIYKEKDSSTSRKNKCDVKTTIEDKFKYPTAGYGDNKFDNTACKISCEEIVKTTFKPQQLVNAGMGYEYPIKINGTRYCTAQYKNDIWVKDLVETGDAANDAYDKMKSALKDANNAIDDDNACGILDYAIQNPRSNNCTDDYVLTNGVCKRTTTYTPSCSSYESSSTSCSLTENSCSCTTKIEGSCIPKTCPKKNPKCKQICVDPKTIPAGGGSGCSSGDGYSGGICYHYDYKPACDSGYTLDGSVCKKPVCKKSREDWAPAQSHIQSHLTAASNAKAQYTILVSKFNTLMKDRAICDSYASSNTYQGPKDVSTSYSETKGSIQVSKQKEFDITESIISGSSSFGEKTPKNYDIKESKNKSLSVGSSGYNSGTIGSYSGSYIDYTDKPNVTYYDFWNEKSTADDKLEFSKNYYVQRYTGVLSTTTKSGYDLGGNPNGRRVYTDFYEKSGTQDFSLKFDNIGPNLPLSHDNSMKIKPTSNKFGCLYNVDNLIFPPKDDKNYPLYGNVAFSFRQISLTDPFPNRSARTNWKGNENKITNKGYDVYKTAKPIYSYYLTPSVMQSIRAYNHAGGRDYGSYNNKDPYISSFLKEVYIQSTSAK